MARSMLNDPCPLLAPDPESALAAREESDEIQPGELARAAGPYPIPGIRHPALRSECAARPSASQRVLAPRSHPRPLRSAEARFTPEGTQLLTDLD